MSAEQRTGQDHRSAAQPSLYERLGSEAGIARLVDDIVAEHMRNPAIRARFEHFTTDPARLEEAKRHLRAFIAAGSGGPDEYTGKPMHEAHRGMNIDEREYLAAIDDIMAVLERHGLDEQTRKDMLAIAYSLKGEILYV